MKKLLFTLAAFAPALGAMATSEASVDSINVFGMLAVKSPAVRTLVAIPWCECSGTDNQSIAISNVIKTANLEVGNTIHVLNEANTAFETWRLAENADGVKYWQSVKQVSSNGVATETDSAANVTAQRGRALMLMRNQPGQDLTKPFYLYGQVGTQSTITTTDILQGSADSPKYSLISSAKDEDWDVNDDVTWSNVGGNDQLCIYGVNGLETFLVYKNSQWCAQVAKEITKWGRTTVTWEWVKCPYKITAGTGIWYVSHGGKPSVQWNDIPVK